MSDFVLPDGTEVNFDLSKLTYGQWLGLFDPKESDERSDETLARVAGLTIERLKSLGFIEYKKLFKAFVKRSRDPLSDPND